MAVYLGDIQEDATVHFMWSTNDGSGASITRATNGTVSVYKDNGDTQSAAGVTDTEDFDSLTGVHVCTIVTTDAFYAKAANYSVVLSAATIDGQVVNAVLAHFSIENRSDSLKKMAELTVDPGATPTPDEALMLRYHKDRDELSAGKAGTGSEEIRNDAGAVILSGALTDDGNKTTRAKLS